MALPFAAYIAARWASFDQEVDAQLSHTRKLAELHIARVFETMARRLRRVPVRTYCKTFIPSALLSKPSNNKILKLLTTWDFVECVTTVELTKRNHSSSSPIIIPAALLYPRFSNVSPTISLTAFLPAVVLKYISRFRASDSNR